MTPETAEHGALAARLDAIFNRLERVGVQARGLVTRQTGEAKECVVRDDPGGIRGMGDAPVLVTLREGAGAGGRGGRS